MLSGAVIAFTLFLALRDLLYRYLLVQGVSVNVVLLVSGFTCLAVAVLANRFSSHPWKNVQWRFQLVRLVNGALAYFLILESFRYLSATSVALFSKAYIPALILLGPILGIRYSKQQNFISVLSLLFMAFFVFLNRNSHESLHGYLILIAGVVVVMAEFIMLRKTAASESTVIVAGVPALACVLFGGISLAWHHESLRQLSPNLFGWAALSGVALYGVYAVSRYRYLALPLGLAEYPALAAVVLILLGEGLLFGGWPKPLYLINVAVSLSLLGYCLFLNRAGGRSP